jgi:ribosomal protein S18 acetylase RimI-like enzyme
MAPTSSCSCGPPGSSGQQQDTKQQLQRTTVAGYVVVQTNSVTAHVNKLCVSRDWRRQGIGSLLLRVSCVASCRGVGA